MKFKLSQLLEKYTVKNSKNYEPVAVGRYGIRKRSDIYKKELANDYSKNKVIFKDTLIIGMGSVQIDIGVLCDDHNYSVSPAYHTFKINTKIVLSEFLEILFAAKNYFYTQKYMIASARQGKKVDVEGLLQETVDIPGFNEQELVIEKNKRINKILNDCKKQIALFDELVKSRFIEMFGYRLLNLDTKISSIAEPIIGLTYKPENVTNNGTIVLRSGNIKNNELQLEEDIVRVSNIKIPDNKIIRDNDILMCSRNGSARLVGKSCLIHNPKERMSFGAFMTVIRTKYPYFLQAFFSSDFFKEQLTSVATTSVNQITSGMLNNYNVIEPTEKEELIFSRFVKLIDKSKFNIRRQIKLMQELLDVTMCNYFGSNE